MARGSVQLASVLLLFGLCCAQPSAENPCSNIQVGDNRYNLAPLADKKYSVSFEQQPFPGYPATEFTFDFSVCSNLASACPNTYEFGSSECPTAGSAGGCLDWNFGGGLGYTTCFGSFNGTVQAAPFKGSNSQQGLTLTYFGGDMCQWNCQNGLVERVTYINIVCDQKQTLEMGPKLEAQEQSGDVPNQAQTVTMYTIAGCPGSGVGGGLSPGSVMLIILLVLLVVYVVVGILVNKFVRQQEGLDLIPNRDFWFGVPGLVADGFRSTHRFISVRIRGTGGEVVYTPLAST